MLKQAFMSAGLSGAVLAALGGCTSLPVVTDVNPEMSASNCHTYSFAKEYVANQNQPAAYGNPLNAERLRVAIEYNLTAKGLQRLPDTGQADCVVGYAMGSRQVFDDFYGGWGVGGYGGWGRRGYGGWAGGWGWDGPPVQDETRISVDLFDAKSHKPIWHAWATQRVGDLTGPRAQEKISAATAAIFKKFPVPGAAPATASNTP